VGLTVRRRVENVRRRRVSARDADRQTRTTCAGVA
jgi:hypothetical protein